MKTVNEAIAALREAQEKADIAKAAHDEAATIFRKAGEIFETKKFDYREAMQEIKRAEDACLEAIRWN
jgi:hypothetical protein